MARRLNELFIGEEFLNEEGRDIKHIGLISEYGNQQYKKTSETPLLLEGMDLETDSKTGELKLLGVYNGDYYRNYTTGFLGEFFEIVKSLYWRGKKTGTKGAIAYWNKLDPFVLYKQFLLLFEEDKQKISMRRYGKISGEWNTKQGKWKIKPITEVEVKRGTRRFRFGIKNVIRSSVLFYFYEMEGNLPKQLDNGQYPLSTVWAYDVAQLYKGHLAKEMESRADIFPYYSKIDESAHLVDWDRYFTERHYRVEIVDKSNYFDAKAVFDLGNLVSTNFYSAFQCYPKNLISAGAIARASVIATFYNKYEGYGYPESEIWKSLEADAKSIALINYKDVWAEQIGEDSTKDMFCAFYEAYSGGYIEAILYGLIEAGYSSDIASAYIKYITMLKDLRDSIITTGEGVPPHIDNSYCVIRGRVKIPLEVNFMPITVKHVTQKATNVRAVGEYIATYHIEERDYMIKQGAEFFDETWWNIETTGKISPYGEVATLLTDKRYELLEQGDSAEYLVKTATASLYGILFEATHTYKENIHMDVFKAGIVRESI